MYIIILNHIHGLSLPHKCKVTPHHYNIQYFSKIIIFEMEKKHTYLLLFFCIKIFIPHIVCGMRKKTFMPHPPSHHKKKSRLIFFGVFFCLKNVFSSKPSQTKSVFYVYSRCHEINLLPQMNIIIDIVFI